MVLAQGVVMGIVDEIKEVVAAANEITKLKESGELILIERDGRTIWIHPATRREWDITPKVDSWQVPRILPEVLPGDGR
jgi:hypothetical protein